MTQVYFINHAQYTLHQAILFLESVVATSHLVTLEADEGKDNESTDKKNSAHKAPTMETATVRWS